MSREPHKDFSADLSVSLPDALAALERELAQTANTRERARAQADDAPRESSDAPRERNGAAAEPTASTRETDSVATEASAPKQVDASNAANSSESVPTRGAEVRLVRPLSDVLGELLLHLRGLTRADAGTIFLRHGDTLRFTVVQNDFLARQVGEAEIRRRMQGLPVPLQKSSIAGFVGVTGEFLNIADVYAITAEREYRFNRAFDVRNGYRTRSVLAAPIVDDSKSVVGVIELINALDDDGRAVAFTTRDEEALRSYTARTAGVIATDRSEARHAAVGTAMPAPAVEAPRTPPPLVQHLGEVLVHMGMVTPDHLAEALAEQRRTGNKLGSILVRSGFVTDRELIDALSRQYGLDKVDLSTTFDAGVVRLVPKEIARQHSIFPVARKDGSLQVATSDPTDLAALDAVSAITGLNVVPVLAAVEEIHQAIERAYDTPHSAVELLTEARLDGGDVGIADVREDRESAEGASVTRLVNGILNEAIRRGASDIHFESFVRSFTVRFRVDGVLSPFMTPSKRLEAVIVSRIKRMAGLDTAEHRLPQEGRIKLQCDDRPVEVRVSVVPTLTGESLDLRILDRALVEPDLAQLGFEPWGLAEFNKAIQHLHGIVLVAGPTGSGRTTTLYSAIHALNKQDLKILTIEDPVEYSIDGVNQVHVQKEIGRTFAATLRAFLRHDADVILVGDIRDADTAQTVVRAGLNGQLVLSALHTSDCASTIAWLLEMGIPPFMLAETLKLVVAQRLVRKLCLECRRPYDFMEDALVPHGHVSVNGGACTLYQGVGCRSCNYTGMNGHMGIFEVMPVTSKLAELIVPNVRIADIRDLARQQGMKSLRELGLVQVLRGVTTLEEVLRVTSD